MRATYKLGRDVITEFEAQNAGNSISGSKFQKCPGMPSIGMSHGQGMRQDPRLLITIRRVWLISLNVVKSGARAYWGQELRVFGIK